MSGEMGNNSGISGSTLKIIAVVTMLMDHIAAVVFPQILAGYGIFDLMNMSPGYVISLIRIPGSGGWLYLLYLLMRWIPGRMAFPVYCFLLVEGFDKTRSRAKYAGRLFLFVLISEIPFNLAFRGRMFDASYQSVFVNLLLGFLMIWAMEEADRRVSQRFLKGCAILTAFCAAAFGAELLRCDYGAHGIIAVALLYLFRKNRRKQIIAGCVAFLWEVTAPLAFVLIARYNGRRGMRLKYIFYIFYPAHLLVLYFISQIIVM